MILIHTKDSHFDLVVSKLESNADAIKSNKGEQTLLNGKLSGLNRTEQSEDTHRCSTQIKTCWYSFKWKLLLQLMHIQIQWKRRSREAQKTKTQNIQALSESSWLSLWKQLYLQPSRSKQEHVFVLWMWFWIQITKWFNVPQENSSQCERMYKVQWK